MTGFEHPSARTRPELRGSSWAHARGHPPLVASAAEYARRTVGRVRVSWEPRSLRAFGVMAVDELARDYDLLVIDHPHVGTAAAADCLIPLDELVDPAELDQLAAASVGGSHQSYRYGGRQWAVAVDAAAQVSAYRTEALPRLPTTWADVLELARSGRVLWPLAPADAWSSFLTLAAARGTPCFERSGELIAVSDGVAVLTAMTALRRRIDDGCLTMDPIDVLERLSTGSSAVYCPLIFGYSNYARRNFRPARLGFADIPSFGGAAASGALLGGVGIAVSRRCPQARDAASYAVWAAGGEVQRTLWFGAGGQPGNAAAWDDPALDREAGGFFSATRPTLEASWMRPRFPGFPALQEAGMRLVHEFLAGGGDPEQTIAELNGACRASSPAAGLR